MSVRYKIRDQHGLNYLTCSICGWVDLFSRAVYRDIVLESWRYCAEHKGLQIWGYVIMPNHLHMITSTTAPFRLEDVMRDFKAHTARKFLEVLHNKRQPESRREWLLYLFEYFARPHGQKQLHQLWQHDNHPIELFTEAVTIQKLRYIHQNPVRAGWVTRPEDWLYSSARNYLGEPGLLEMPLLWSDFATDSWFFGDPQFSLLG